jgi:hypothetical protein
VARLQGLAAQLEDDLAAASAAPGGSGPVAKQPGADVVAAAGDVLAAAAGEPTGCAACCSFEPSWPDPAFASARHGCAASCQQAAWPTAPEILHAQHWTQDACAAGWHRHRLQPVAAMPAQRCCSPCACGPQWASENASASLPPQAPRTAAAATAMAATLRAATGP